MWIIIITFSVIFFCPLLSFSIWTNMLSENRDSIKERAFLVLIGGPVIWLAAIAISIMEIVTVTYEAFRKKFLS